MNNERMIDAYFLNNIRIDFEPVGRIKGAELQLLVNNIFNAKYESNAYGGNWFEDKELKRPGHITFRRQDRTSC